MIRGGADAVLSVKGAAERRSATRSEHATEGNLTASTPRPTMTDPTDAISLLVALEFVVTTSILLLLVPLDVAAPVIPLAAVFLVALHAYRS
jgi:Flp pilus assembly protein TadB